MRSTSTLTLVISVLLAACGGAAAPTAAPGQPTAAPGQPTVAPGTPTAPPVVQPGGGTVSVTLTGGADAGTYTGSENPSCSFGLAAAGTWGTQYSTTEAGAGQLCSVQMVVPPAGDSDAHFTMLVTIGPLFDGNNYEITPDGGTGSAQINDAGATAVIHATGTTEDGVGMDVTVNCPSVIRM